eukprot:240242-Hanusia_phi.AAC.1
MDGAEAGGSGCGSRCSYALMCGEEGSREGHSRCGGQRVTTPTRRKRYTYRRSLQNCQGGSSRRYLRKASFSSCQAVMECQRQPPLSVTLTICRPSSVLSLFPISDPCCLSA